MYFALTWPGFSAKAILRLNQAVKITQTSRLYPQLHRNAVFHSHEVDNKIVRMNSTLRIYDFLRKELLSFLFLDFLLQIFDNDLRFKSKIKASIRVSSDCWAFIIFGTKFCWPIYFSVKENIARKLKNK